MGALIPEYRTTLGRMKTQVDNLRQRLEDACEENHALQEQVLCSIQQGGKTSMFVWCAVGGIKGLVSMDLTYHHRSDETMSVS